jgi:hypothetical protein
MKAIALAIESSREDFRDFFFIAPCRRNVAASRDAHRMQRDAHTHRGVFRTASTRAKRACNEASC